MVEHTDPAVFTTGVTEGWADVETDPTRIDWPHRQRAALIPFQVVDGRPVSPGSPATVRRGRNGLGLWGENAMADALVTVTADGLRYVLLVERRDGHGWAVPGGAIDAGETPVEASARELGEETGLVVPDHLWVAGSPMFVPDPRGSDEAWAVTVVACADLGSLGCLPAVRGASDARRAEWVPAGSYAGLVSALGDRYGGQVFPAHVGMLTAALGTTVPPVARVHDVPHFIAGLCACQCGGCYDAGADGPDICRCTECPCEHSNHAEQLA